MENPYEKNYLGDGCRSHCFNVFNKYYEQAKDKPRRANTLRSEALAAAAQEYIRIGGTIEHSELVYDVFFDHFNPWPNVD